MDNIMSWSAEDEAIIATNTDAAECKRSAVELGYYKDDYIQYFAKHVDRKAPEINRGYFARVRSIEMFIQQFIERCGTNCQIISLGCGFDTLFWRLKETTQAVANFIEMDFPSVTAKKTQIIKRNKKLLEKISNEDSEVVIQSGDLVGAGYRLLGADLRCVREVRRKLSAAAAGEGNSARPTLVLAECVLVYLPAAASAELLAALAELLPVAALLCYEQVALDDRFGEVMLRNLRARGCGLAGVAHCASPAAAAARLETAGWRGARVWDMARVWAALPAEERARAESREPLDEAELLSQLHAHYALALAHTHDMFADMGPDEQ